MNIKQESNQIEESDSPYSAMIKSLVLPKEESNQFYYETNTTYNSSKRTTTTLDLFQLQDEIDREMDISQGEYVGDFNSSKKKKKRNNSSDSSKESLKIKKKKMNKTENKNNYGAKNIYKFIGEQTLKITKNSQKMDYFLKLKAPFINYDRNYLEILMKGENSFDHWLEEKKKNSKFNFYLSKKSFKLCWKRPLISDNSNWIDFHYYYILKKITKDFLVNNVEDFLEEYKKKSYYSDEYKQKIPKILNLIRKLEKGYSSD